MFFTSCPRWPLLSYKMTSPRLRSVSFPGPFLLSYGWSTRLTWYLPRLPHNIVKFLGPPSLYLTQVLACSWPSIDYWMALYVWVTNISTIKMERNISELHPIISRSLRVFLWFQMTSRVVWKLPKQFSNYIFHSHISSICCEPLYP